MTGVSPLLNCVFQSTLPRRERPSGRSCPHVGQVKISIHAPAEGATSSLLSGVPCPEISIHAPAEGATAAIRRNLTADCNFNPRSRGGSDIFRTPPHLISSISIHAPAEGATTLKIISVFLLFISIHAPAEGATNFSSFSASSRSILIHAPAEGATEEKEMLWEKFGISIHAPAEGATTVPAQRINMSFISIHAPAEGATKCGVNYLVKCENFNPRSRGGSDTFKNASK